MSDLVSDSPLNLMGYVGPVHEGFIHDQRMITAIMGPFGSAKTTGCIRKIIMSALWQNPQRDGVRRVRWCCIRDTYSQLETNVMESWFLWFPKTKANWNGRKMQHIVRLDIDFMNGEGVQSIEIEMLFRAMQDRKAEDVLKGMELTGLWMNETDTLDQNVFLFGWPRTGRYPAKKNGGCQWRGVICDFNAPDIDNWTYPFLVEGKTGLNEEQGRVLREQLGPRFGIGFWRQPGGLSDAAENKHNLGDGYYEGLLLSYANKPNYKRRFIDNEYGAVENGQVVYPEFNADIHLAKEAFAPDPELPVIGMVDGGKTPALLLAQLNRNNQFRVFDEVVLFDPKKDDGLRRLGGTAFGKYCREYVSQHHPKLQFGIGFYDPSCAFGGNDDDDDEVWIKEFVNQFAGKWKAGGRPGNRLEPRLSAVRDRFNLITDGQPGILISPRCNMTVRGFQGGYIYERVEFSNGSGRFRDIPLKNAFSHPQDAVQYGCLGVATQGRILDNLDGARRKQEQRGKVEYGQGRFRPNSHQNAPRTRSRV